MTLTRPWYLHIDHRIDGCYPSKQGGRMNGNQSESFIIVGGTILIFGSFFIPCSIMTTIRNSLDSSQSPSLIL
jgi:hypothetical protein